MMREIIARFVNYQRGASLAFRDVLTTMFLVLPALLPFVRRSAPPLLICLAVVALIAQFASGRSLRDQIAKLLAPAALACAALFIWGALSLAWSPMPERGFVQLAAIASVFASGFILTFVEPGRSGAIFHKIFALCLAIGGLIVTIDLLSGLPIASLVRNNDEAHRYNMIAVSLLILCWGLSARTDVSQVWLWAAWLSISVATFVSDSESAKLALLTSGALWILSMLAPRRALVLLLGFGIALCWACAPWLGNLADAVIGLKSVVPDAAHAEDRLLIWRGSGAAALAFLPWGAGAGSALAFAEDISFMGRFDGLGWGHTHNNFLQVWLELGLPGVLLGGFASLSFWRMSGGMKQPAFQRCCALVGAICVIALVSHGLWQAWFWAAVFISLVALRHTGYYKPPGDCRKAALSIEPR